MDIESLEEKNEAFAVEEKQSAYRRRRDIDIVLFMGAVEQFFSTADRKIKKEQIEKIWACCDWYVHYTDKRTGRCVYSETSHSIGYKHELHTAIFLAQAGYDILFAPMGMFNSKARKFDIFLIRETSMFKADLKFITSTYPNSIANRIHYGSTQASRVVLHIGSNITPSVLIDALRSGCHRNSMLIEILLIYRNSVYMLPKEIIVSKRIFKALK